MVLFNKMHGKVLVLSEIQVQVSRRLSRRVLYTYLHHVSNVILERSSSDTHKMHKSYVHNKMLWYANMQRHS